MPIEVSIITPLFNAEKYISETLDSVLQQTYLNWEMIVVDDASIDASISLVQEFLQQENRIKLIALTENHGAAYCRNLATKEATGKYIAFLDADDKWHPHKLEKQIQFMESNECLVSFTNYLLIDEDGNSLKKRVKALPRVAYKKQHSNNYIGNLTGMYNAKKLGKIYAPNLRKRQDWAVWLEAIKKSGKPALGLQEDLAYYRVRQDSMSANKLKLLSHNFKFYNKYLHYSKVKSSFWLLRFLWEYFVERPKQIEKL